MHLCFCSHSRTVMDQTALVIVVLENETITENLRTFGDGPISGVSSPNITFANGIMSWTTQLCFSEHLYQGDE